MNLPHAIPSALRGSSFEAALAGLGELYEELEENQSEALASIAARGPELACPEGCGSCCEGFVPDLLPVEARYLAAWLLAERPELAGAAGAWPPSGPEPRGSKPPCPFHEAGRRGGKCGVYPARPLICRLFAFSALRGRDGLPGFALCKRMPSRGGRRSWSGPELAAELGELLPDMAHYGALVAALVPEEAGRRALLVEALPAELRRLSLVISLSAYEEPDREDPDEPEPSTPAPAPAAA
ncbi:MAG TPA: YkgJ family cysteine cluster protein [Spirochaetales bacterium]|nr:YkgJ family cysteine cluster protein [Spirochaetales bacterium]HRY53285.1 YkgJ family cysteine cluster protein [Spirochaetia bacterium]HRZ64472.1 YkgJ family cysteine cluster protein [Spirochaetia bacterium]